MLWASGSGLIFSMRLHDRKCIQSVKSVRSVLHSELKIRALTPLNEGKKGCKTSTHTDTQTHTVSRFQVIF